VSIEKISRSPDKEGVTVIAISTSAKQSIHSLSINPEEDVSVDDSVPFFGTNSVGQGSFESAIIHRLLISKDGHTVCVVSYRYELPSIAALERSAPLTVDAEEIQQSGGAEKPNALDQIPIVNVCQVVQAWIRLSDCIGLDAKGTSIGSARRVQRTTRYRERRRLQVLYG
jgi:hypothetical protein